MGAGPSGEIAKYGYHVLQVQPNSPGAKAGLVAYFDFIVAAQGIPLTREDSQFVDILKTNIGKEVRLVIYNLKSEGTRETVMIPSDSWGGSGLAGISIRFCPFEHATEQVWHVLDVYQDSPASAAGLEPRTDYIVGTPELLLSDSEDFFTLIASNEGKSIPLYVYSTNTDNIRQVQITPNSRWGGNGSLGCDIGYGYLHRIPLNRNIPNQPNVHVKHPIPGHPRAVPTGPTGNPTPPTTPTTPPTFPQFPTTPNYNFSYQPVLPPQFPVHPIQPISTTPLQFPIGATPTPTVQFTGAQFITTTPVVTPQLQPSPQGSPVTEKHQAVQQTPSSPTTPQVAPVPVPTTPTTTN